MVDDSGNPSGEDIVLQPVVARTATRRRALWGVLAVVAVAAGALAVTSGGSDTPPRLPVALGASSARESAAGGISADMAMAWVTYVAGDGLPALGGDGAAYRLRADVDEARVRALADALGLSGDVTHEDRMWRVQSDDAVLEAVEDGGGSWWYSQQVFDKGSGGGSVSSGSGASGGSAGCEPGPAVDCAVAEEGTAGPTTTVTYAECPAGATCASPPESSPCPDDTTRCAEPVPPEIDCPVNAECMPPEPIEPAPPADLPSQDEARKIALDLLAATGMDVDGAKVTVDGPYDAWYVTVEPTLDGVPVAGWVASAGVGSKGVITSASGTLATPERLGDYPLLDTKAAIERFNELQGTFDGGPVPMGAPEALATDEAARDQAVASGAAEDPCAADGPTCTTMIAPVEPSTTMNPCKVQPDGSEICEATGGTIEPDCVTILPEPTPEPSCPPPPDVVCEAIAVAPDNTDPAVTTEGGCPGPGVCAEVGVAAPSDAATDTTLAPMPSPECPPYPEPEPVEVVLTDAERVLVLLPSMDGGGDAYLVPGYRFSNADGAMVDMPAVNDDSLAPTTTVPAPTETTSCETAVEGDGSGTTHTIQTCPGEIPPREGDLRTLAAGEQPELGVPYYVDLNVLTGHCSWVSVEFGGRWWLAMMTNDELGDWSTPTEGGSFTLTDADHATFVGDAEGTKQANLEVYGDGLTAPGCA